MQVPETCSRTALLNSLVEFLHLTLALAVLLPIEVASLCWDLSLYCTSQEKNSKKQQMNPV